MEKQNCGPEDFRGEVLHQMDGDYIRAKLVLPEGSQGLKIIKTIPNLKRTGCKLHCLQVMSNMIINK